MPIGSTEKNLAQALRPGRGRSEDGEYGGLLEGGNGGIQAGS